MLEYDYIFQTAYACATHAAPTFNSFWGYRLRVGLRTVALSGTSFPFCPLILKIMIYILIAVHVFVLFPLGTFLSALWWKKVSHNKTLTLGRLVDSMIYGAIPLFGILVPLVLIVQYYVNRFLEKKGVDWNMEIWK